MLTNLILTYPYQTGMTWPVIKLTLTQSLIPIWNYFSNPKKPHDDKSSRPFQSGMTYAIDHKPHTRLTQMAMPVPNNLSDP